MCMCVCVCVCVCVRKVPTNYISNAMSKQWDCVEETFSEPSKGPLSVIYYLTLILREVCEVRAGLLLLRDLKGGGGRWWGFSGGADVCRSSTLGGNKKYSLYVGL